MKHTVYHAILRDGTVTFLSRADRDRFIARTGRDNIIVCQSDLSGVDMHRLRAWRLEQSRSGGETNG